MVERGMVNDDKVVRKEDWRKLLAMLWPMFGREKMTVRSGVLVFSVIPWGGQW